MRCGAVGRHGTALSYSRWVRLQVTLLPYNCVSASRDYREFTVFFAYL